MSWFAEFAGKAENFLNQVDQGAATALSKDQSRTSPLASYFDGDGAMEYKAEPGDTSHHASSFISSAAGNIKKSAPAATSAHKSSLGRTPKAPPSSSASSGFVKRKKSTHDVDDDLLFDFLNSSEPPVGVRRDSRRDSNMKAGVADAKTQNSAPPGAGPSLPSKSPRSAEASGAPELDSPSTHAMEASEENSGEEQIQVSASSDSSENLDSGSANPQDSGRRESRAPSEEGRGQVLSSLRLENQLLRREVASLNQEMASVIQRSKETQEELKRARLRVDERDGERSQSERALRGVRSQVDDLNQALAAKDGQLAVLKVRLDEADQLLRSRSVALEEAQEEKSRILEDQTEGSTLHSQALESTQERLREAEQNIRREEDNYRQMQSEYAGRQSRLESERQSLAEALTAAERRASEDKLRADGLQQQLRSAKSAAESAKQELLEYKHKASRILQSKEKLISSLKEGSSLDTLDGSGSAALELEELRHEKELHREEIQKLQGQLHSLRTELQDSESQSLAEAETWRQQAAQFEERAAAATNRVRRELEAEVERHKQELQYAEEEHHRTKGTLQSRIKDREDDIQKLRNQLTNKTLSSSSQSELENRLHQLTETLIQKQTTLEALGTEKTSLVFQLERLEQQLKSAQGGPSAGGPSINMSAVEGPGARQRNIPVLFNHEDASGVYGKVQKAAGTIDRFSIRLGIFLRRYPMARIFVILYMVVLHLWVMIVLLTYSPEMHEAHP
ncbi:golgin subfamily A member 5 [Stigmatopora argus]